jgi:hypothetical protein
MATVIPSGNIRWIANGEPVDKTVLNRPTEDLLFNVNDRITTLTSEMSTTAAASAAKLTNARNIYLTGDVTGSVATNFSGDTTIATTIAPNSIALGTDTTGSYVANISAGTGITVTGSGSENATVTIGTQLKTINGTAITGAGNITISSGAGSLSDLGVTSTAAEINQLVGVTSAIQTQLNSKESTITTLPVNKGGTGGGTFTANAILLGNGTSGFLTVAPSTSGNVLTSDGTTWVSAAPSSSSSGSSRCAFAAF